MYAAFFVSEEKIWLFTNGTLKNDYLLKRFFDVSSIWFYFHMLLPFLVTWLVIWKLPKYILNPAYFESESNKIKKDLMKKELSTQLVKEELKVVKLREQVVEKEKDVIRTESESYKDDFEMIMNNKLFKKIDQIIKVVYDNGGKVRSAWNGEQLADSDILALMHTRSLITLSDTNEGTAIELTEKGKRFLSEYLSNSNVA